MVAAVLLVVALLVGAGIGYLFGANSQTNSTRLTSFGISGESCSRMGTELCGEELSFFVTNTTRFAKVVNGSDFLFLKGESGISYNVSETYKHYYFDLNYETFGTTPPNSGCPQIGIASEIYVVIPEVDGFYPVSNMTISSQPPACSGPLPTSG